MNSSLVYAKTPIGDEAVRQSTRVVQRNLRMVLVQIDGKLTVGELGDKIGNYRLVESAIKELEEGGFIVPSAQAAAAWEMGKQVARRDQVSAISQFSTFGKGNADVESRQADSRASHFSTFGKPILPASGSSSEKKAPKQKERSVTASGSRRNFGALIGWGLAGVGLLLVATPFVYPYDRYRGEIEAVATSSLRMPVRVGGVSLKLMPAPHLQLSDVRLETSRPAAIGTVRLLNPLALLTGGANSLAEISIVNSSLPVESLLMMPSMTDGFSLGLPALRKINLEKVEIRGGGDVSLATLSGNLSFNDGRFAGGELENEGRSLMVKVSPGMSGLILGISGRNWQPGGQGLTFDSLMAKGVLQVGGLEISDIDTTFLGGILKGNASLGWRDGLSLAGTASLARISMRQIGLALAPNLRMEGDLAGRMSIQGHAGNWDTLWPASTVQLDAEVTRGLMQGVDLGEALKRGPGATVRAGSTRFDRMQARCEIDAGRVSVRNISLSAGAMSATGQLTAGQGGAVEGGLTAAVSTSVTTLRLPLKLTGRLPDLTLLTGVR